MLRTHPAALNADICLALHAGEERSVAATKSFIASCVAGAAIVANWSGDRALLEAVARLPETLAQAARLSWEASRPSLVMRDRSSCWGAARPSPSRRRTALKLKETCAIHAEAYSVAEVMHGPWELMEQGFPVLVYAPSDAAHATTRNAVEKMRRAGADVRVVENGGLPFATCGHALLDSLAMVQTAYLEIERVAAALGRNPDRPRLLKKVTETL